MCGIWDWQSTIFKDLNDSQDPKHALFCREIVFVAIYALFSDNKCPFFTRLGGWVTQSGHCPLFYRFSFRKASLSGDVTDVGQTYGRTREDRATHPTVSWKAEFRKILRHLISITQLH